MISCRVQRVYVLYCTDVASTVKYRLRMGTKPDSLTTTQQPLEYNLPVTTRREKLALYLDTGQIESLRKLSEITRVPVSVYIREAIDDLLKKYAKTLKRPKAD